MATLSSISLLLLEFILIHYHCGATEDCKVTVTQDKFQETYVSLGTVTLSCSYTATACTDQPDIYWFRYLVSQSETLCTKATCIPRFTAHFTNPGASLAISSLQLNDSAIYVCGIVFTKSKSSTSKATGHGTTVVVRDRALTTECTVLIIICALLLVYSIAVFAVYAFLNWSKLKLFIHTKKGEDLTQEDPSKSYRRRRIFQAIAQELYHKRYAGNSRGQSHVPEDDTIYQNT
ncbi:immunoglobulin superfamily member 6 [Ascaphus truei]|uniref:immunoglobulin superfamily member 6 n=1 Tax=Ascaphus truei TaxID=8439 RepID=UPI003F594E3F